MRNLLAGFRVKGFLMVVNYLLYIYINFISDHLCGNVEKASASTAHSEREVCSMEQTISNHVAVIKLQFVTD